MSPYKSRAQAAYMHAHEDEIGKAVVAEFDKASKGLKLPERVKRKKLHEEVNNLKNFLRENFYGTIQAMSPTPTVVAGLVIPNKEDEEKKEKKK